MTARATCPITWAGAPVDIEYRWVQQGPANGPLLVFLHEGLGSVAMWKDFPDQLCAALGWQGLVYSRPGYGWSTPRAPDDAWAPDFLERQAREVLPAVLDTLGVDGRVRPLWLLGHSDGGSIALIHAAAVDAALQGVIAIAPHIMVEDLSVDSIRQAREAYLHTDLRSRLARHHRDPDSAFWGWNDVWLSPAFRSWSIEAQLHHIRCPVLALQGADDEYGTLAQIEGIRERLPQTRLHVIPDCGHSPHRDQPEALTQAIQRFTTDPA